MNRRHVTGVVAGVLAALVLGALVVGAYRAGERDGRDDRVLTQVVADAAADGETGEVVRVIDDRHGPRHGGFVLFPLLIFGLVGLLVWSIARGGCRGRRHRYGPWSEPGGGPPWIEEWHRRAHQTEGGGPAGPPRASPGEQEPDDPGATTTSA